jgi:hypothetical protein
MNISIKNPIKAEIFTLLFQHIRVFTEHVNVIFQHERMYIQSMDSCRISIFEISLPCEWFDVYDFSQMDSNNTESITIGIHSTNLFKVLSSRDKNQNIYIDYDDNENSDKLNIHFISDVKNTTFPKTPNMKDDDGGSVATTTEGGKQSRNAAKPEFDKHFEIPLIDIDSEILAIPEQEYQAEFSISSFNFATIINQLKMFGDNLDVSCTEDKILLCSSNLENGKMFVDISIDDLSSFMIDEGGNIKMSFSLNSLHNICLYNKLSREVVIFFKDNFPMKIVYPIFGDDDAKMTFFLAPKITDGDDN